MIAAIAAPKPIGSIAMFFYLREIFQFLKLELRDAMHDHKQAIDLASIFTTLAALAGFLPVLASLLSVIWMAIRIYETDTVQKILGRKPVVSKAED